MQRGSSGKLGAPSSPQGCLQVKQHYDALLVIPKLEPLDLAFITLDYAYPTRTYKELVLPLRELTLPLSSEEQLVRTRLGPVLDRHDDQRKRAAHDRSSLPFHAANKIAKFCELGSFMSLRLMKL